jgi:hypothetical protein
MTYRHLLPDEIDQLLDGETGFGIAPLEAHVRECAECRAELEAGRRVVDAIEHMPRLAPSPLFAEHVMAQVNVYEPWDVAARDAVANWAQRLVPQSRPLRVVAGAVGLSFAAVLSVACVWLTAHLDAVFFVGSIARARLRDAVVEETGAILSAVFGSRAIDVLGAGSLPMLLGVLSALVLLVIGAAFAVRSLVSTPRRGRT